MRHQCSAVLLDFQPIDTFPGFPGEPSTLMYFKQEDDPRILRGYWDGFGFVRENGDPFDPCCWAEAREIDQDEIVSPARAALASFSRFKSPA